MLYTCCLVQWLACLCSERIQRETQPPYLSTLARRVESVSAREEEETANGRDRRVTAACSHCVGNTLDTQRVRKGVGPVARGMV